MGQYCPQLNTEVTRGQCNQCNQDLVGSTGFCCKHISCHGTCDWYKDPDRCNLARDMGDALLINPAAKQQHMDQKLGVIDTMPPADKDWLLTEIGKLNLELRNNIDAIASNKSMKFLLERRFNRAIQTKVPEAWIKLQVLRDGPRGFKPNFELQNKETIKMFEMLVAWAKQKGLQP